MGRHNGNAHAEAEAHRLRHQPPPPMLAGERLRPDDRVTFTDTLRPSTAGRVLWCEWRDLSGEYVDPTARAGRDKRKGQWHALVLPDDGVSRWVAVRSLTRKSGAL